MINQGKKVITENCPKWEYIGHKKLIKKKKMIIKIMRIKMKK